MHQQVVANLSITKTYTAILQLYTNNIHSNIPVGGALQWCHYNDGCIVKVLLFPNEIKSKPKVEEKHKII